MLQYGETPKIKPGERVQALPQRRQPAIRLTELLADGPEHGANTRRLRLGDLEQAVEAARLRGSSQATCPPFFSGDSSLDCPRLRRKSRRAASVSESVRQESGRRVWITVSLPTMQPRQARPLVATSTRAGFCVVKPSTLAAADTGGEYAPPANRQRSDLRRIGPARPERRRPGPVIEALAQPLDHALAGQARQCLRHRHERQAVKVGHPPDPLAAGFDPLANGFGGVSCVPFGFRLLGPHDWDYRPRAESSQVFLL